MWAGARKGRKLTLPGGKNPPTFVAARRRTVWGRGRPAANALSRAVVPRLLFLLAARRPLLFLSLLAAQEREKNGKRPAKWPPRPTDVAGLWPREAKPLQGGMGPLNMETTFLSLSLSQKKRRHGDHLSAATSPVTFSSQQRPSSPVAFFAPRRHSSVSHAH